MSEAWVAGAAEHGWLGGFRADNVQWLSALIEPLVTLLAAFGGAWFAFRLERKHREHEDITRRIGAANRALYTLANFWNILYQYKNEVIEPFRGKPDAWLNMLATVPSHYGLASFEAGELSFLLQTSDANTFAVLMLEEQRFWIAIRQIEIRSSLVLADVRPKFSALHVKPGTSLSVGDVEQILGIDTVYKLRILGDGIVQNVDADLSSIRAAHDELREVMKRMYPDRKVLTIGFGEVSTSGQQSAA